jgi:hypothetical protein
MMVAYRRAAKFKSALEQINRAKLQRPAECLRAGAAGLLFDREPPGAVHRWRWAR